MFNEDCHASIEQARIMTAVYNTNPSLPGNLQRAVALYESLKYIDIRIMPDELIVGNRTPNARAGVISPELGLHWVDKELENLPMRTQDKFGVRQKDLKEFRRDIIPFWKGKTLEDKLDDLIGEEMDAIGKVVKINQTDHFQGHIFPNTAKWLKYGPAGLRDMAFEKEEANFDKSDFYEGVAISLDGACIFMKRYAGLAQDMADSADDPSELLEIARICEKLSCEPPETFHEALQSMWFLYVMLHMESNAPSLSPGRMDQYLYPYYLGDIREGRLTAADALELVECLFLKFNQIVNMRSSSNAKYFAGFPIGFNVAVGGLDNNGSDAVNELSYLILRAQEHLHLPQPNLSARLHDKSPDSFLIRCAQVIGKGSGMPQVFNDEAVIPALLSMGISPVDARNYAISGCVELTTMGNNPGWNNAAIFNIVKALELALNDGRCTLTGMQLGAHTGTLMDHETYEDVERALESQIDFFFERMIRCCEIVDRAHAEHLPSPLLSSIVDDCMERGLDVAAGGAFYNMSGIQAIQCTNIADSLAALKMLVYDEKTVDKTELFDALLSDYKGAESLRLLMLNEAPKSGNTVQWVDELACKCMTMFSEKLSHYRNVRGGLYHMGLYTMSAHVSMGANVGATPDGRKAGQPLANGGIPPVYGHDVSGTTAVLRSVTQMQSDRGRNGALLNMKFLPQLFSTDTGINKLASLLRTFVELRVIHAQFNVVSRDDLLAAQKQPELYRNLIVRVAGHSAYFTELAPDIQQEIIERS